MTKCHSAKEAMTEIYAKTGLAHLLLIYGVSAQCRTQTENNYKLKHKEL